MTERNRRFLAGQFSTGCPCLKTLWQVALLVFCWFASTSFQTLHAHSLGQSYVFLGIHEEHVSLRFEITVENLNQALSLDLSTAGDLETADFLAHADAVKAYLGSRLLVFPDGRRAELLFDDFEMRETSESQYLAVSFALKNAGQLPHYIDFEYTVLFDRDRDHRGFVIVENDWNTGTFDNEAIISLIFEPGQTSGRLDLMASTFAHGFWEMIKLGVHHIWVGIDHILFLLALLLPSVVRREHGQWTASASFRTSLWYVVKIVTLFTVAHTITLSAATLGAISISPRIVESIIAISIAIAAMDVLRPMFRERIWWIVFAFGLFHGLGFASVLAEIGVPPGYMAYSLLAFNIGVELGQLAIVSIAFPLLYLIRQGWLYQRLFLPLSATALILVSMYWFVERGFMIDLPAGEYANWVLGKVGARG